jgi:tripartite-type tricarboxylate transporter receptor subunit TctC
LTRLIKTPGWRKYLESNYLEEGFLTGAELNGFVDDLTAQMRDILKEAGAKVVR